LTRSGIRCGHAVSLVATAVRLARQSHAEVLVLSVRERTYARGLAWDIHQPGDIAETVSRAIYELERAGVRARGLIRTARSGYVADEIIYAAYKHHADEIIIGTSRRSWLGGLMMGSVAPRVLRRSDLPVVAVPTKDLLRQRSASPRQRLIAGPKR
jgi:nucleotide-binding universal stress UspA family protein